MKKVLLATTALVFTAGYAAAEVTVSGSANFGLQFSDSDAQSEDTELHYELDFGIAGSTTTDGGIEVGASLDFDLDDSDQAAAIDDPEVFVSSGGITLTVGAVGSAQDTVLGSLSDPGFDGIGIDDTAETFFDTTSQNVQLKGECGAITVAATGNIAENDTEAPEDFAVAGNYDGGAFSVGLGFASQEANTVVGTDIEVIILSGSVTAGGADISLFFHQASLDDTLTLAGEDYDDISGFGASVEYTLGAVSLVGTVGATDLEDDEVDFGVGFEYDLGGGVALAGGIGSPDNALADDDSFAVADFGITMDF